MQSEKELEITTDSNKKTRMANLDLLRWLCSIFVVFLHFCGQSEHNAFGFAQQSSIVGYYFLQFLYGIAITAVPVFFVLSGYLSINSNSQNLGKTINLFVMTIVCSFIGYFGSLFVDLLNHSFVFSFYDVISRLVVRNYYLYLYCAVYALSPYINKGLKALSQQQLKRLLLILFILFSLWSTLANAVKGYLNNDLTGVYFTSLLGTSRVFSIVNFLMLYAFGCYLKLFYKSTGNRDIVVPSIIITINSLIVVVLKNFAPSISKSLWYYDSFFVIISAIMLVVLFINIQIKENRLISFLGTCTFGVFLLHGGVNALFEHFITIELVVSSGFSGVLLGILLFVLFVHLGTVLITCVIKAFAYPINRVWKKTKLYNIKFFNEQNEQKK